MARADLRANAAVARGERGGLDMRIWHYGLVARWWAETNVGGDDVRVFHELVKQSGEPVLDAGCGTGRVLLPMLAAGVDVDGSDASSDMTDWCQRLAAEQDLTVDTYPQAMHELALPRKYRTIIVCGAFGLGGSRGDDLQGLRRLHDHLQPGGTLLLDHYLPNRESPRLWPSWVEQPELPRPWPQRADERTLGDGTVLAMKSRMVDFDPLEQHIRMEISVRHTDAQGAPLAEETGKIDINLYFKNELMLMLDQAGFRRTTVSAFGSDQPPQPWRDARILFRAEA